MFKQYRGVIKMFKRYWSAYGGFSAVLHSPYLHVSLAITLLMYNTWLNAHWWDTVISIIPNLTGFTLGGFAIIVTFGNDEFKDIIYKTDENDEHSIIATIGATFVHFILLQIISLMLALSSRSAYYTLADNNIILKTLNKKHVDSDMLFLITRTIFWCISWCVFIYALVTVIAATFAILRLVYNYQTYVDRKEDE